MIVAKIDSMMHRSGKSIAFDSLDGVEAALRRLGEMRDEKVADVDQLIGQMRHDIKNHTTVSAGVRSTMSHYQHGEEFRTPGGRTLEKSGRVWGCNYFSHNSCGLTQDAPFCDLEVKVEKIPPSDGKPAGYTLTLFDNVDPGGSMQPELLPPRNHTESSLVYSLTGTQRPLQRITTNVEFEVVDGLVQFDFEWIISRFGALKGVDTADVKPSRLAWRFYQHLLNRRFGSCVGATFPHSSGAAVALNSLHGIDAYKLGPHQGIHKLVKRTNAVLSGPLQPSFERPYVCIEFLGNDQLPDQQLIDLFEEFKAACLDSDN